jgi:transcriptional regulator with XRE-family HTH domain
MPISAEQKQKLKILGLKVKSIRKEKKLTLQELAYSIGKDHQSIYRLETGGVNPSYLYLLDICKGLEISLADLLMDENRIESLE